MSTAKFDTWKDSAGTREYAPVPAWVNFNGTGTVSIRDQLNVSSITDNGTGDYTANFTTAMANTNYVMQGTASQANTGQNGYILSQLASTSPTVSAMRFRTQQDNVGVTDPEHVFLTFFGGI